jgi:pyruvate formate lyase activating enzyme
LFQEACSKWNLKIFNFMNIGGYQKLTLIDYPGRLASTVFTVGCSFRCPFCHNPELVENGAWNVEHNDIEKEFFKHLEKRKGILDGVCITGGEPTIQGDILEFIIKIKELGYAVKLDSNGTRPDILKKAIDQKIVDFIAMDIKNQPKKYLATAGVAEVGNKNIHSLLERIKLSVDLVMNSRIPYEFRTTAVPGIHTERDFLEIAEWIDGARSYWLQRYQEKKILDPNLKKKTRNKVLDLEKIRGKISGHFGEVGIRG